MKKVAMILSGCGSNDGSETREVISVMLALSQQNIKYECFSLDKPQAYVYDHYKNEISTDEKRNILIESARLARGKVKDITLLNQSEFDGLVFPGGYGVSLNLSNFSIVKSAKFEIDPLVERVILDFKNANKPFYFLCISSIFAAKMFPNPILTLGGEKQIIDAISKEYNISIQETSENIPVVDKKNKFVTTPCYLVNVNLAQLHEGISEGVKLFAKL